MTKVLLLPADAYRMIDNLRDYADILDREGSSMADFARNAAERIDAAPWSGGLIEARSMDVDAAHSATIALMADAYGRAQELRDQAAELDRQGKAQENFLSAFTA